MKSVTVPLPPLPERARSRWSGGFGHPEPVEAIIRAERAPEYPQARLSGEFPSSSTNSALLERIRAHARGRVRRLGVRRKFEQRKRAVNCGILAQGWSANPSSYRSDARRRPVDLDPISAPLPSSAASVAEVERRLSVIQQAEAAVEASRQRAQRLRQSILKRAFSGDIWSRDWCPRTRTTSQRRSCWNASAPSARRSRRRRRRKSGRRGGRKRRLRPCHCGKRSPIFDQSGNLAPVATDLASTRLPRFARNDISGGP